MKLRRFLYGLLVLALLISLGVPASANSGEDDPAEKILYACTYGETVDMSTCSLSKAELDSLMKELFYNGKLPWYTTSAYQFSYSGDTGRITSFTPENLKDVDPALYEQAVAAILEVCVKPGMSDYQIALSIHDYLVANAGYDETEKRNSGYDLLVNGSAVCAGYALAYMDLMNRAGVECRFVVSNKMNHGWNLVKIDGQWYHVDVTWDDPTPNSHGRVDHTYFLLTDEEISSGEKPHYDWDTEIRCTDTRFSDAFWRDVSSAICYESKDRCYLLRVNRENWNISLYHRDADGRETLLFREQNSAINIGNGHCYYPHRGLSLQEGRLWYSTVNQVQSLKTDGSDRRVEYKNSGSTYIAGSHLDKDKLYLTLAPHSGGATHLIREVAYTGHVHAFSQTRQEATCLGPGYTLWVCSCGLEAESSPTAPLGHSYEEKISQSATLFREGYTYRKCTVCGEESEVSTPSLALTDFLRQNSTILIFFTLMGGIVISVIAGAVKKRKG